MRRVVAIIGRPGTGKSAVVRQFLQCAASDWELRELAPLLKAHTSASLNLSVLGDGYRNALYDRMLSGWRREEVDAFADGARERIEVLWLSPSLCTALSSGARDPFGFKT